jgi:hypothetical protein
LSHELKAYKFGKPNENLKPRYSSWESGCRYNHGDNGCVCKQRCPAGMKRYGDGSACTGGGKRCDFGWCHNNPNGGLPKCHTLPGQPL